MWLFGYGSLMWDGWETRYGCLQRMPAIAPGHARIFNKKSLERWGTRARPGLTLNLTPSGNCQGIAFEFDDARQTDIEAYLSARETCAATDIAVNLPAGMKAARTYIYDGPRLIENGLPLRARAAMILAAQGTAGSSHAYLRGVRDHLDTLGVTDPAVDELWHAVTQLEGLQNG